MAWVLNRGHLAHFERASHYILNNFPIPVLTRIRIKAMGLAVPVGLGHYGKTQFWRNYLVGTGLGLKNSGCDFGQATPAFDYLARGRRYTVFVNRDSATVLVPNKSNSNHSTSEVRIRLLGARAGATTRASQPLLTRTNYFIGNDPRHWKTNVPNYGRVAYEQVYPGVDLIYYGKDGELEFDFAIAPAADPQGIRLAVEGAKASATGMDYNAAGDADAFAAQIMPLCPLNAGNLTVTICKPGNGTSVTSPVTIMAGTRDTLPVKLTELFVDGSKVYEAKLAAIMVRWPMSLGTHQVTVRGHDYVNQPFSASVNVSVGP